MKPDGNCYLNYLKAQPGYFMAIEQSGLIVFHTRLMPSSLTTQTPQLTLFDLLPPEEHARFENAIENVFSYCRPATLEHKFVCEKTLETVFLESHITPVQGGASPTEALVLTQDITKRKHVEESFARSILKQSIFTQLLEITLEEIDLQSFLEKIIKKLCSIPWFRSHPKGCIFIIPEGEDHLTMAASLNFTEEVMERCKTIKIGECICGATALSQKLTYVNHVDCLHSIKFDQMCDHGHYCIPIFVKQTQLIGVVNIYLDSKQHLEADEDFLTGIGHLVGLIVTRKQTEQSLSPAIPNQKPSSD